jgi:HlyD family secretion protein
MTHLMDRPIQLPWWRRPAYMRAALAAAALLLLGGTLAAFVGTAERSTRVQAASLTIGTVQKSVFHDFVPLRGKVVPRDTIYLDAREGGQVERVLVQPGDRVQAGQPLVVFRNSQLELEVLDRIGRLVESITQLQTYQTQLEVNRVNNEKSLAQIDYAIQRLQRLVQRQDPLAAKGYVAVEESEKLHDELDYNRRLRPMQAETNKRQEELRLTQLPRIQAELASLQQSLEITRGKLDDLTVKAPLAGQVTVIDLKIGENRNRGERLAEIVPDTGFKLSADIDEFYRGRVQLGQMAEAELDGARHRLRVTRVYPQVQNGVFIAELEFQGEAPHSLVAGAAVQGKLALGTDRTALLLPAGAFLERSGGNWIFVVAPDGQSARRRAIRLGRRNVEQIEILGGLSAGEKVIVSDYTGFERIDRIDLTR